MKKQKFKYTERYIAWVLATVRSSPFNVRTHLIVPNVYWGLDLDYEADLVVLTKAGYATEVEIKTSLADLKADQKKKRVHNSNLFKYLYFCFPEKLLEKGEQYVPERAGILLIDKKRIKKHRAPKYNTDCIKFDDKRKLKLLRLGLFRYWNCIKKEIKRS